MKVVPRVIMVLRLDKLFIIGRMQLMSERKKDFIDLPLEMVSADSSHNISHFYIHCYRVGMDIIADFYLKQNFAGGTADDGIDYRVIPNPNLVRTKEAISEDQRSKAQRKSL